MRLSVKLGALVMVGGAAGLMVAGVPALASSHSASVKTTTGPEVILGTEHGKAAEAAPPRFVLTFRGLADARKVKLSLAGDSASRVLSTSAGKFAIQLTGQPQTSQRLNLRTCKASFTETQRFKVVGSKSTRSFAGASGPGAFQLYHAADFGRFTSGPNKGKCNRADQLVKTAVSSLIASVVLTVRS